MKQISFDEAKELINSGAAGFFEVGATGIRAHADHICLFVRHQWQWYLCGKEDLQVVDEGLMGDAAAWGRAIIVHAMTDEAVALIHGECASRQIPAPSMMH